MRCKSGIWGRFKLEMHSSFTLAFKYALRNYSCTQKFLLPQTRTLVGELDDIVN